MPLEHSRLNREMNRATTILVVAGAVAALAAGLWRWPSRVDTTEIGPAASRVPVVPSRASSPPDVAAERAGESVAEPAAVELGWRASSLPSPRYAEPDEIEVQLGQFLAQQTGLAVGSLSSIVCGATYCKIALTGMQTDPRYVDEYEGVYSRLSATPWNDFRVLSSSIGTQEIAPGAREYVIGFEYQPLVDLSPDPLIAARQYAACAAAWRRQTENPTPSDFVRRNLAQAEHYVALAASVLGEEEATRVAAEIRGGPLIRECGL
jgi:hypothetical protein